MQTNEKNLLCLFCHRKTAILNETHVVYDFDKFVLNFPITLMPKISRSFINVANKMVSCKDCIKLCELICEPIFFRESLKLRYNSDVSLMLSNMEIAEQNTLLSNSFQTQFEDRKHSTENASTRDNFAYIQDFRQKIKNYFTQKLTTSLTENDKEDSFELDDSSDVGKEKSICCKEAVITYYDGNNTDQLGIHYENPSTSYPNPELQAEVEARDGIRIRIRYVCSECSKIFVCEARFKEHLKNHDIQTKQKNLSTQTNMVMRNKLSSQDSSENLAMANGSGRRQQSQYLCIKCNMTFPTHGNFLTHMVRHGGSFPFTCRFCGESFQFIRGLNKHIRTHVTHVTPAPDGLTYLCCHCQQRDNTMVNNTVQIGSPSRNQDQLDDDIVVIDSVESQPSASAAAQSRL